MPVVAKPVTSPDGVPVAYEVHGTGTPAVVFIHGWSCDRSSWAGQLEPFSREFQVVASDRRWSSVGKRAALHRSLCGQSDSGLRSARRSAAQDVLRS